MEKNTNPYNDEYLMQIANALGKIATEVQDQKKAKYMAFDYLVDLALDEVITLDEAIGWFIIEQENGVVYGKTA